MMTFVSARSYKIPKYFVAGFVVLLLALSVTVSKASAATFLACSPGTPTCAANDNWGIPNSEGSLADNNFTGDNVQMVVSNPFSGNSLYAPWSDIKIYSTDPTPVIRIYGTGQCGYNATSDHDSNTADNTNFNVYYADSGETVDFGSLHTAFPGSSNGYDNNASCTYQSGNSKITASTTGNQTIGQYIEITLRTDPTDGYPAKSSIPGHDNYYSWLFEAMGGVNVNGFRVRLMSPGYVAYSQQQRNVDAGQFALQNRHADDNPNGTSNFGIPLAPNCSITSPVTAQLRWSDDDWGTLQTNQNFVFKVRDNASGDLQDITGYNSTGSVHNYTGTTGYPRAKAGNVGTATVKLYPGHAYTWTWYNVTNANGIQFTLPYDAINATLRCKKTIQGVMYTEDAKGNVGKAASVSLDDCNGNTTTTDSNGNYTFTEYAGDGFCVRPDSGFPAGYSGPKVRPWSEGYGNMSYCTSGFGGITNPPADPDYCTTHTITICSSTYSEGFTNYGYQIAGADANPDGAFSCNYRQHDRKSDSGYDFVFYDHSPGVALEYPSSANPVISQQLSCDRMSFATWDNDNFGKPVTARVYLDTAPSGVPNTGTYTDYTPTAQEYNPDGTIKTNHTHGATFNPRSVYGASLLDGQQHTIYIYALGIDDGGATNYNTSGMQGTYVRTSFTLPICGYAPTMTMSGQCTISGTVGDQDKPGATMHIEFDLDGTAGSRGTGVVYSTTTSTGSYSFNAASQFWGQLPSFKTHPLYGYVEDVDQNGNTTGYWFQSNPNSVNVFCPPAVSCELTSPTSTEAYVPTSFKVHSRFGTNAVPSGTAAKDAPSSANYKMSASVSGPGVNSSWSGMDPGPSTTDAWYTTPNFTPQAGVYSFGGSFYGTSAPYNQINVTCPGTSNPFYDMPYFKAFGNDVVAGGGFDGSLCNTAGTILASQSNSGAPGAGAQFAAYAIGHIKYFNSAAMRAAIGTPVPPRGLSFSDNTGFTGYGGDMGGTKCINDWFSDHQGTQPPGNGNINPIVASQPSGSYTFPAAATPLKLSNNPQVAIPNGSRYIIYVDGNVEIQNNIFYDSASRTSLTNIPSFWLVVHGNIYIDNGVTRLDGVYVAQPNGATGGEIYTCSDANGPTSNGFAPHSLSDTSFQANCGAQLTVNGAFVANKIDLLRSYGTARYSTGDEYPYGANHTCQVSGASAPVCAAEVFNFSPEIYLAPPNGLSNSRLKYDAITELPPVL